MYEIKLGSKFNTVCILFTICMLPFNCVADTFDMFGNHSKLKNTIILDAGDAEEVASINRLEINAINTKKLKLNGKCFNFDSNQKFNFSSKTASLLLIDNNKKLYISVLSTFISNINVDVFPVIEASCSVDVQTNLQQIDKKTYDHVCKLVTSYKEHYAKKELINLCTAAMPIDYCIKCIN